MRKLLRGIARFRTTRRPEYAETFARLALGQKPDALFFACSDSRVVPNLFASTEPGDLFVVRNVGNLVPPCGEDGLAATDESEGAAVEFAVDVLGVRDVIVCGHSSCGAMQAVESADVDPRLKNLGRWVRHAAEALSGLDDDGRLDPSRSRVDRLSQRNALVQLEHLYTYPSVRRAAEDGRLALHAWWFDIANAEVLAFLPAEDRFAVIDEDLVERLLGS